jgi:hypothetical protein
MMLWHPVARAKATLAGLQELFLQEAIRANRSFTESQLELATALQSDAERGVLTRGLGGRPVDAGMLRAALAEQAKSANRLAITEVKVTFWAEPVPASFWERLVRFFMGRKKRSEPLFRLAPAERRQLAVQYELTLSPSSGEAAFAAARPPRLVAS